MEEFTTWTSVFLVILAAIVVVVGGIIVFSGNKKANAPESSSNAKPSSHIMGSKSSGVILTEYGDYQCPACGQYYQPVKEFVDSYKDKIQFQFRNFPLTSVHPNAFAGSRAAEAAALQGKFWEMHDMLYENQQTWSVATTPTSYFDSYAKELGLNVSQFQKDFASSKVNDIINADLNEATKAKLSSTPSFFLDGVKIDNPNPSSAAFKAIVDKAIAKKAGNKTTETPAATDSMTTEEPKTDI